MTATKMSTWRNLVNTWKYLVHQRPGGSPPVKTLGVHWHFWHLLYAITPATALWFYAEYREPRARSEHGSSFLSRPNNPKDLTDTAWKVRRLEEELQNISSPVDTQQSPERRGCSESGDASEKLDKIDNRSNR
eukprot:gb/GECG01004814.1/.p1 GENE.gb/GECG01004814.1/~~gb/GECG01004814.1/.p1  ORF type:complete len:133 (+),score=9.90 gb/GECG01004814.1/:1-399(+)